MASEQALIVWDPDTSTQTFIRSANFEGKGRDFGFIVPTPTEPELSEVNKSLFNTLNAIMTMRLEKYRGRTKSSGRDGAGAAGPPAGVEVIKQQTVAGMKATVLRANDSEALRKWLSRNGYPADRSVLKWTEYYVRSKYYLTAFKIDRKPGLPAVRTSAMKMVFKTPFAFYPYREPVSDQRKRGRNLSVYFLGPWIARANYVGTKNGWEARRMPLDQISAVETAAVAKVAKLSPRRVPNQFYMTHFYDRNEVRQGYDLAFEKAPIR